MAEINDVCPDCKEEIVWNIGQLSELKWYESTSCPLCGYAVEADAGGFMPEDYRKLIIEEEGLWQVSVDSAGNKSIALAKMLRQILGLDLKEAMGISKKIPTAIFTGTQSEMLWICDFVISAGLCASVQLATAEAPDIVEINRNEDLHP